MTSTQPLLDQQPIAPASTAPDVPPDAVYDLVCVGFGPAALATAIALHDSNTRARVLFVEKQPQFGWHTGMLLPGAHMQISFMKDLATMRDPSSHFTFLNYLHHQNRLAAFSNLSTLTPLRAEFNDYLAWCAGHFAHCVIYGAAVLDVQPAARRAPRARVSRWHLTVQDVASGTTRRVAAQNVVVAAGGTPYLPPCFTVDGSKDQTSHHPAVLHSSAYLHDIARRLPDPAAPYRVAVVGGGQSAAEIFEHLFSHYPNAAVTMFTRDSSLRPSDDSPFVNQIFDADRIDTFYADTAAQRRQAITSNRATNYSVVNVELLEALYERLYRQRLETPDAAQWRLHICHNRELQGVRGRDDRKVDLHFRDTRYGTAVREPPYDLVVAATGYRHDAHHRLLRAVRDLLPAGSFEVARDYRLQFRPDAVEDNCGIWLQGCCEQTHGISDSLLSVLATRSGELVHSIFGAQAGAQAGIQPRL